MSEEMMSSSAAITVFIIGIILCILLIVAKWKIFTKAGIAGWKSLIPIYNVYLQYKISGLSFWKWSVLPILVGSVFVSLAGENPSGINILWFLIGLAILIFADIKFNLQFAKAFGKGVGFALGLIFLPNIFQLILGYGSAQYVGNKQN